MGEAADTGEPALLRLRSLLFSAATGLSGGWRTESREGGGELACSGWTVEPACDAPLYVLMVVSGLNVTVRRSERGDVVPCVLLAAEAAVDRWY